MQTLRQNLGQDFNQLVWVAGRWREHPDYAPRWRPRHYLNRIIERLSLLLVTAGLYSPVSNPDASPSAVVDYRVWVTVTWTDTGAGGFRWRVT
ncbi:hypothetical protein [Streptomyces sp. NPDC059753]|uniref:hypothetical protein n=1 Tax=Streptomyces sp. NPDC059753 TaxID=3346933 RepID=UPI003663011F